MKTARPVPKVDELTELISSRLPGHLYNVASQGDNSGGGGGKRGSALSSSSRGNNVTFSNPSLPKHWNRASISHKPASNSAANINFKLLAQQQHHHHHPRRAGSFDSFETGSSAICWSDSDDSTTFDSVSIGSDSCASYASSVSDIIWGQVVRTPTASSDSNPLQVIGGSGNKTSMNRSTNRNSDEVLHSKLRWNGKVMLGILALLALSGSLVYLAIFNNYQSMFQISKQQHDTSASSQIANNNDPEVEGNRDNQLRLSYRKLPNGENIVEMVPDIPVLDKENKETTGKKEAIPIPKRDKRKGKNNGNGEAASLRKKKRMKWNTKKSNLK